MAANFSLRWNVSNGYADERAAYNGFVFYMHEDYAWCRLEIRDRAGFVRKMAKDIFETPSQCRDAAAQFVAEYLLDVRHVWS